jgi:hypothetical protein
LRIAISPYLLVSIQMAFHFRHNINFVMVVVMF